ncbi:MAG: hypothetical protein WDN09_03445 [bacterium]
MKKPKITLRSIFIILDIIGVVVLILYYVVQHPHVLNRGYISGMDDQCPATWMGNKFYDSYDREVIFDDQHFCNYSGVVTGAQCDAEGGYYVSDRHGAWCQKWINDNKTVLSIADSTQDLGGRF